MVEVDSYYYYINIVIVVIIATLTCVICAEPRHSVESRLTVVDTAGAEHLSSPLSALPSRRTNSSIKPLTKNNRIE